MKILIAPDSFKGSLTSIEAADAIAEGFLRVFKSAVVEKIPMADGGEGTVEALISATGGSLRRLKVKGPLGENVDSFYGVLGDGRTAVIEMAAASGLTLIKKNDRNPLVTTSYGTGELIRHAIHRGFRKIILGIGGSATNDAGAGMAQALGVRFLDPSGRDLPWGGLSLRNLARVDLSGIDHRVNETEIVVACDVDNPLCGPRGASAVYGPQKGATPEMIPELDGALKNFAYMSKLATGREAAEVPGAGAAGGMGAGLLFFTNAVLKPGIQIILEATQMKRRIMDADLVITGEGMTDSQTSFGKAPAGIGELAAEYNKVAICLSGSLGSGVESILSHGIDAFSSIAPGPITLNECISHAPILLEASAFRFALALKAGMALSNRVVSEDV